MKIIFTGSSSFTGYWFIKSLVDAGHEVVATFSGAFDIYGGIRKQRVERIKQMCGTEFNASFGTERFAALLEAEPNWDMLCHHAADVSNYKSPDFNIVTAVAQNTRNAQQILRQLMKKGCNRLVITGTVFEQNEGAGSFPMRAFSPYGLSKGISADIFRYYASQLGMAIGKFVIPNPFGPYEEPRFTAYLINNWREGKIPRVSTPAYVRDNIHISLLALAYARFVGTFQDTTSYITTSPSGYVETQGAFAARFASEMQKRLNLPCQLTFANQVDFPEPQVRINTEPVSGCFTDWNEEDAWEGIANFYR